MKKLLIALIAALFIAAPLTLSAAPDEGSTPAVTEPTAEAPTTPAPADAPKAEPKEEPASAPAGAAADTTSDKPKGEAKAAEPEKQGWWQVALAELLNLFLVIFVPVLSTLIVTLLRRWKINVEFEQVNSIAVKAAGWAEQKALVALKEGMGKTPGGDKMKLALDFANGLADQYKLSAKATAKLQELIESSLGQEKMKAAAAEAPKPEATEPA